MASLQANADSIRAAVGSISTCTPATAALLSDLFHKACKVRCSEFEEKESYRGGQGRMWKSFVTERKINIGYRDYQFNS
jgi:hypothetical protein